MPLDLQGFILPSNDLGLGDSDTVFPISVRRLAASTTEYKTDDEKIDPGEVYCLGGTHKCIVREDTGQIVGVVGSRYGVLRNEDFFKTIEDTMREAIPLDMWEGVQVRDSLSRSGSFCRREYVFPAYAEALANTVHETKMGLRVIATNSYDGGSSASLMTGLIDFYCTNGMILGKNIASEAARHSSRLSADQFVAPLKKSIEQTEKMVDEVRRMIRTPISTDDAADFLEKKFSKRRSEALLEQFGLEVEHRGMNAFALLSALTYYASHDSELFPTSGSRDNSKEILHYREHEVQKIVSSADFTKLLETT